MATPAAAPAHTIQGERASGPDAILERLGQLAAPQVAGLATDRTWIAVGSDTLAYETIGPESLAVGAVTATRAPVNDLMGEFAGAIQPIVIQ